MTSPSDMQVHADVAVLKNQVGNIEADIAEMKPILHKINDHIQQDKGKTSAGRYVGLLISGSIGGVIASIVSHFKIN